MAVTEMFYKLGQDSAYDRYGIEKVALRVPGGSAVMGKGLNAIGDAISGLIQKGRNVKLKDVGSSVKNFMIGKPRQFYDELKGGKALSEGGLIREGLKAPGLLNKALFYGLPAYEAGSIAGDAEGDKAKRLGESLGGSALSLAAFGPLGLLGAIGGGMAGGQIGGAIGTGVGHLTGAGNTIYPEQHGGEPGPVRY
jgi:hypothetical protein